MKKLIIHVGYPKTATTTMQINVLSNLMRSGEIEYLNHVGPENKDMGPFFYKQTLDYVLGRGLKKDCIGELSELKKISRPLTVISNETLSHVSEKTPTAAFKIGAIDNIKKLKDIFSLYFETIEVVMTVRAQDTMISSYYTQEYYNIVSAAPKFKTIGSWIQANIGPTIDEDLLIFNYNEMYKEICKNFGKDKTHVLVYEDLIRNKQKYFAQLAIILGFEKDYIEALFEITTRNKTLQTEGGTAKTDQGTVNQWLALWAKRFLLPAPLKKAFKKIIPKNALMLKIGAGVRVNKLSTEELELIRKRYSASNRLLIESLNLDVDLMKSYGYF